MRPVATPQVAELHQENQPANATVALGCVVAPVSELRAPQQGDVIVGVILGLGDIKDGLTTLVTTDPRETIPAIWTEITSRGFLGRELERYKIALRDPGARGRVIYSELLAGGILGKIGKLGKLGRIKFGQANVKGVFAHGPHAGKTIGEIAEGLRSGAISPDSLPIDYIVRNGEAVALNNRSLTALRRAGLDPTVTRDLTGNAAAEALLDSHLRGGLPSETIRIRGGPPGTSLTD